MKSSTRRYLARRLVSQGSDDGHARARANSEGCLDASDNSDIEKNLLDSDNRMEVCLRGLGLLTSVCKMKLYIYIFVTNFYIPRISVQERTFRTQQGIC